VPPNLVFTVFVGALLLGILPLAASESGAGASMLAHPATPPSPAVGDGAPTTGFGKLFPAPRGGPDPALSSGATTAVQRLLQHRTEVASLVAHSGAGYAYASGVAWLAYAPWDQAFYVAAPPSSVDEIPAGSTGASAVIAVGADPFGVAVDNATDQVWVTNTGSNNVTVINGTTQAVVANITVGSEPLGIAVNPGQARVFVATNGTNGTSMINATSFALLSHIAVGVEPTGVVYDGATNQVFVSDRGSSQVTVLNGFSGRSLGNVSVGSEPDGLAVDNATDTIYVANEGSENVSVIAAASDTLNATVPIVANGFDPDLQGVAYDSERHLIWVTAGFSAVVINTSEERAVDEIIYDPAGIAYDPTNGDVCLTNSANRTYSCFSFGSQLQADANVTFSETGLPSGTTWNVTLAAAAWNGGSVTQAITGASFVFGVDFWTHLASYNYTFTIQPVAGEAPNPLRGYVTNNGTAPSWVNVTFRTGGVYDVRFNESGLSYSARPWSVTLGGFPQSSNGNSITFQESNGTYPFTTSGWSNWTSSPRSGNVTVAGRPVNVTVNWSPRTGGGSGGAYTITLDESGLPNGTRWGAMVSNATDSSGGSDFAPENFVVDVYPGTYQYTTSAPVGWNASDGSGTIVMTNASVTLDIDWGWVGFYPVTFAETGLPNGTLWGVDIGEVSNWSETTSVVLDESNGTYAFTVVPISGYTASTTNKTVTVEGSAVTVSVQWTVTVAYALTFQESGLANGTQWTVTLTGPSGEASLGSTTPSVTWSEPNGTYQFQIARVAEYGQAEYVATPSNGSVQLNGAAQTLDVRFSLTGGFYNITFREGGLPAGSGWSIGLGGTDIETTGTTIIAVELNGSYTFTTGGAFGYDPLPSTGRVNLSGRAVFVQVNFTIAPGFYAVTFTESGLGTGTPWSVTLGSTLNSTAGSVVFSEPNGSFPYTVAPVAGYRTGLASGVVSVDGSPPPAVNVTFVSTDLYAVSFQETGLPRGTGWAVSIGSELDSSLGPNVTLLETNGTFGYLVLPVAGFTTTYSGFVVVAGTNRTVGVDFVPQTYPVIVVEFGLPNGTLWSVLVTNASAGFNATFSTNGNALVFELPNGTYALSVRAGGFTANLSVPTFTVAGKLIGSSPTVRFGVPGGPGSGGATAVFSADLVATGVGVALLAGVALGALVATGRRRAALREGTAWLRELSDSCSDPDTEPRP
jgi:YVTN family beta-propeller protein